MNATLSDPLRYFEVTSSIDSVDADKGVIKGVSLITSGLLARGHSVDHPEDKELPEGLPRRKISLEVDSTTLDQMLSCAEEMGKVPVKWNHKTGADAVSGYLKNFRIKGKKLVGDWHLLKSHERFSHALELASEMPECLGLSTSFAGKDEIVGERAFARCSRLVSADLVASPAANPDGFFEEGPGGGVDSRGGDMANTNTAAGAADDLSKKEFSLADVMAGIHALNGRFEQVEDRLNNFESVLEEAAQYEELEEEHEFEEEQEEPTEFANGSEALQYLSEKLAHIEDAAEQAKVDRAFSAYEDKVGNLIELNEQLAMENAAMAEAIHEFSEQTGAVVSFSASAEGEGYEHHVAVNKPGDTRGAPRTEFEARCRHLEAEGKDLHEAIRLAVKEDSGRYQRHLQETGVMARSF